MKEYWKLPAIGNSKYVPKTRNDVKELADTYRRHLKVCWLFFLISIHGVQITRKDKARDRKSDLYNWFVDRRKLVRDKEIESAWRLMLTSEQICMRIRQTLWSGQICSRWRRISLFVLKLLTILRSFFRSYYWLTEHNIIVFSCPWERYNQNHRPFTPHRIPSVILSNNSFYTILYTVVTVGN